ncbi:hypothetical protein ACG7TL_003851 [Trametes sanguinea]
MSPQRNMGWRKPVPRLTPEPSISSQRHSRSALRRLSLTIVNKDVPPLPTDWRESLDCVVQEQRRYAVYISPPPSPPPKDDVESQPESMAPTLVEEQSEGGMSFEPHTETESQPAQHIPLPQAPPVLPRRLSQKSLPQASNTATSSFTPKVAFCCPLKGKLHERRIYSVQWARAFRATKSYAELCYVCRKWL